MQHASTLLLFTVYLTPNRRVLFFLPASHARTRRPHQQEQTVSVDYVYTSCMGWSASLFAAVVWRRRGGAAGVAVDSQATVLVREESQVSILVPHISSSKTGVGVPAASG